MGHVDLVIDLTTGIICICHTIHICMYDMMTNRYVIYVRIIHMTENLRHSAVSRHAMHPVDYDFLSFHNSISENRSPGNLLSSLRTYLKLVEEVFESCRILLILNRRQESPNQTEDRRFRRLLIMGLAFPWLVPLRQQPSQRLLRNRSMKCLF